MDFHLIDYIVNSDISFLKKKPFQKNPFANIKAKIFYAKVIQTLCPELGETKFDRLYSVNDLCRFYRIFKAGIGYIQSHFFKKNKKAYPKPHHYDLWLKDIILQEFDHTKLNQISDIFNSTFITENEYNNLSSAEKKRLSNVLSIILAVKHLHKKL